ncbi:MAG: SprT family zinc-dependent metalloprotease [Pseudomonadota bacterium]
MTPRTQNSTVQYGRTEIHYRLQRSSRRQTVGIRVVASQGVVVTAPPEVELARIDKVVHDKARWIISKLRVLRDAAPELAEREYVSGESYLYLGRHYRLKVQRQGEPGVRLHRGFLVVTNQTDVRAALVQWYRAHAQAKLSERVTQWHKRVGVPMPEVLVREQAKRWASCDHKGTLRFNWRVIQAPMRLVDYVVVHELVHLKHRDHDKRFWAVVGRVMPDYEHRKNELASMGLQYSR